MKGVELSDIRTAFILSGMQQSGGPTLSKVLSIYGAATLPEVSAYEPASVAASRGLSTIVAFNDELLADMDTAWDDPLSTPLRQMSSGMFEKRVADATDLLTESFKDASNIVIDDPRSSLLLPIWNRALKNADYTPVHLLLVRNPLQVAAALKDQLDMITQRGILLWANYLLQAERDSRDEKRAFISYSSLFEDPGAVIGQVELLTGFRLPRHTNYSAVQVEKVLSHEPKLHRQSKDDLLRRNSIWKPIKDAFLWFDDAAQGIARTKEDLDDVATRLDDIRDAAGMVLAEERMLARQSENTLVQLSFDSGNLRDEKTRMAAALELLRADLEIAQGDRDKALADLTDLSNQSMSIRLERDHLATALDATGSKLEVALSDFAAAQNRAINSELQREQLAAQLTEALAAMEILRRESEDNAVKLVALNAKLTELNRERDQAQLRSEKWHTELSHLLRDNEKHRSDVVALRAELAAASTARTHDLDISARLQSDLKKALTERDRRISQLVDELGALSRDRDRSIERTQEDLDRLMNENGQRIQLLEAKLEATAQVQQHAANLEKRVADLLNSTSWRITKPLRYIRRVKQDN